MIMVQWHECFLSFSFERENRKRNCSRWISYSVQIWGAKQLFAWKNLDSPFLKEMKQQKTCFFHLHLFTFYFKISTVKTLFYQLIDPASNRKAWSSGDQNIICCILGSKHVRIEAKWESIVWRRTNTSEAETKIQKNEKWVWYQWLY